MQYEKTLKNVEDKCIMKENESLWIKIKKMFQFLWRHRKRVLILLLWLCIVCFSLYLAWDLSYINGNYILKEVKKTSLEPEVSQPVYSYYLDRSPSMQGFMKSATGTLDQLAAALTDVNQRNGNNSRFFFCDSLIRTEDAPIFYNCLKNGEAIGNHYDSLSINSDEDLGLSTEGASKDILSLELESLNLANLFINPTIDGYRYEDNDNNVNIIITDLNFYLPDTDLPDTDIGVNQHDKLLDEFLLRLVERTSSANICIYHLESGFLGARDDKFSEDVPLELASVPYFVFVLAKNNRTFDTYIEELEHTLSKYDLSYSDKFVMKLNPAQNGQTITLNEDAFFDSETTTRSGFNFANGLLKDRPDNAIALQLIEGQDGAASLHLPVTALHELLPGIQTQGDFVASSFYVRTSVARPRLFDWKHGENSDLETISTSRAYAFDYHTVPYLYLDFFADVRTVPNLWFRKNCYVVDIQFFIQKASLSVPKWVEELNTSDGTGNDGRVRGLSNFFEKLLMAKGEDYAALPESQRYLGSIAIYVTYN